MIHLAIDHGKKVSHAVALSDAGEILFDQEILSTLEGFASIKDALPTDQPIQSILLTAASCRDGLWIAAAADRLR